MFVGNGAKKSATKGNAKHMRNGQQPYGSQRTSHVMDDDDSEEYEERYIITGPTPPAKTKSGHPLGSNADKHMTEFSPTRVNLKARKCQSLN